MQTIEKGLLPYSNSIMTYKGPLLPLFENYIVHDFCQSQSLSFSVIYLEATNAATIEIQVKQAAKR